MYMNAGSYLGANLARLCGSDGQQPCATSQSSTGHEGHASRAVDGNQDTTFAGLSCTHTSNPGQSAPWWKINLGQIRTVSTVRIWNRGDWCSDRLSNFEIRIGNGPSSYEDNSVCATGVTAPRSPPYSSDVSCNGMGRYLFVVIPGNNQILTLCEVQVISDILPGGFLGPNSGPCVVCETGKYKALSGNRRYLACDACPACNMACDACPANSNSPAGSDIATDCTCNAGFSGVNSGSGCSESSSPAVTPTPQTPTAAPTYSRLSAGTCAAYGFQNIDSSSECSTAATALGLADTTVKGSPRVARPNGCIYASNNWLAFYTYDSSTNCGSPDGYLYDCICKTVSDGSSPASVSVTIDMTHSPTSTPTVVRLHPPEGLTVDGTFSASVSISDVFALVGSPGMDQAFVFHPVTGEVLATLQAPDTSDGDSFGQSVSLSQSGEWAVVGAPHRPEGGTSRKGAVYVFRFASAEWSYHSKITSGLASSNDRFGWSVSVDDSTSDVRVLVGCNYRSAQAGGFVEVFEWSEGSPTFTATWSKDIGGLLHARSLSRWLSLSFDFSFVRCLSLSRERAHSLCLSVALARSLTHTRTHTHELHIYIHTHTHTRNHAHTHTHTHTDRDTHTHTHTHTQGMEPCMGIACL